jgi:hypothetical protein
MKKDKVIQTIYSALVASVFVFSMVFLYYGMTQTDWHDFDVFYSAARAALEGRSIYIIVGEYNLPFWYFPWTAWFYIPFAVWPHSVALALYKAITIISAALIVTNLSRYYNPDFMTKDIVLILSLTVFMSLQVMIVGQMEFIFLGLLLIAMHAIDQKKDLLAGLIFPFLWVKPHLLIVFTLIVFLNGGMRVAIISAVFSVIMLVVQTLIDPGWHLDMLRLLQIGQNRVDGLIFTTLPSLLGFQENWVGTGNIPFTIALIAIGFIIVWKFRALSTLPLLSLALTASLFSAPRAYAYDLPLLIPTIIWLTSKDFRSTFWIWIIAAAYPPLTGFSSSTYLITLLVFLLAIRKAYKDTLLL